MYGFIGGGHDYFDHGHVGATKQQLYPIWRNGEVVEEKTYLTTALGREAAAYVRQMADKPFFLYLAFNAPHSPLQAPPELLEKFAHITDERRRTYAAMVWAMDEAVGQLDDALAETGVKDDTLLVFISDNGGPRDNASDNTPLRGTKRSLYEGGIRVPFVMRWPGRIAAGSVYSQPVSALDVLPTALAAAGAPIPSSREIDGVDLLPYVAGKRKGAPHERLFWRCFDGHEAAVREGDWKWVRNGPDAKPELFDVTRDIGEQHDVSGEQPELAARLAGAWEAWNAKMAPSAWPDHIYHVGQGRPWR
jgi:arylsulfatase A-like enzyme